MKVLEHKTKCLRREPDTGLVYIRRCGGGFGFMSVLLKTVCLNGLGAYFQDPTGAMGKSASMQGHEAEAGGVWLHEMRPRAGGRLTGLCGCMVSATV